MEYTKDGRVERFSEVLYLMLGEHPNKDSVYEWIHNVDKGGWYELQEWVVNQTKAPSWCEGIVLLEAVGYMVDNARCS